MTFDKQSEHIISGLVPAAQPWFRAFLASLQSAGIDARFLSGLRSYAEQDKLYAQGRTRPGKIVTNARGGFSWHNFGIAADIGIFVNGDYQEESPLYAKAGEIGRNMGLEWGGDWHSIQDEPHFQCRTGKTLAELRAIVAASGRDTALVKAALDAVVLDLPADGNAPAPNIKPATSTEEKIVPVEVFTKATRCDIKAFVAQSCVFVSVADFVDYFGGDFSPKPCGATTKQITFGLHDTQANVSLRSENNVPYAKFADINAVLGYHFTFNSAARKLILSR